MAEKDLQGLVAELTAQAELLGAVIAAVDIAASGTTASPVIGPYLKRVMEVAGVAEPASMPAPQAASIAALGRGVLRRSLEFARTRGSDAGWAVTDDAVLQDLGDGSAGFAFAVRDVPELRDCAALLSVPGASFLDVGTGVASMAIRFAQVWPELDVVGLDIWDQSIARARANCDRAGVSNRVAIRKESVTDMADDGAFSVAWLPISFIPDTILDQALTALRRALRPGGRLIVSSFAGGTPLAAALADLRTAYAGGTVVDDAALVARIVAAGFTDVRVLPPPTWRPARLVVASV